MKTQLLNVWDVLRTSYWFVPSLFAVGAIVLSLLIPMADEALLHAGFELPNWIRTTAATARSTLSALAGAMVAVTGTVFSVTIVTLSLTSQQLGPRLLRRFMYDLPTQVALGLFLSTGLYCLLLLRVVERQAKGPAVPHLGVLVAVLLAVCSMAVLIAFIHHVAVLIQAPHVVASVARDLDDAILRLFPEKIGDAPSDRPRGEQPPKDLPAEEAEGWVGVHSRHEGYIQAIDSEGLMQLACRRGLVVKIRSSPGDFIAVGAALADVWQTDSSTGEKDDALEAELNELVIVGARRTPRQDVECAIEELAEVAVRSLSPGINDPFTAVNCIDRLGASLRRVAEREIPTAYRFDDQQRLRVVAQPVAFSQLLQTAFAQIRHYGRDSEVIALRLLKALAIIAERAQRPADREAVQHHADLIAQLSDSMPDDHERDAIRDCAKRVAAILESADDGAV